MKKYDIGCKILLFNGILFIVIGIYAVFFNNTPLFTPITWIMDRNFWGNEVLSKGTIDFKIFTWDFLGMFHVIWGVNIFYIVKYSLMKKKEAWAWHCILISLIIWLVVDVYFSFTVKHNSFLLVTIFLALLFIIPLIMTKDVLKLKDKDNNNCVRDHL